METRDLKAVVEEIKRYQKLLAPVFTLAEKIETSLDAIESVERAGSTAKAKIAACNDATSAAQAEQEKYEGLLRGVQTELKTARTELADSRADLAKEQKTLTEIRTRLAAISKA